MSEKHMMLCPHCNRAVLDHLTECPHCGGELTPRGYRPMDEETMKKVKKVTFIVGLVIAVVVILLLMR